MRRSILGVLAFGVLMFLAAVRPSFAYDVNLGGVNLNAYCQGAYGAGFVSVALGSGAGDWVCQAGTDVHNRRPISVQTACTQQYAQYARYVKAKSGVSATSWECVVSYNEESVNLTAYCTRQYGGSFKALLIGATSGDWVCQNGSDIHDRRPISVADACKEQYGNALYKAIAVPPSSWYCLTGPV